MTLHEVCEKMLDNADLIFEVGPNLSSITLTFLVFGTSQLWEEHKKVIFRCSEIAKFEFDKEPDDDLAWYLVLKVDVSQQSRELLADQLISHIPFPDVMPEKLWLVHVSEGGINLEVICAKFDWEIADQTVEELARFT